MLQSVPQSRPALSWLGPHLSPASVAAERGALELQGLILVEPRLEE